MPKRTTFEFEKLTSSIFKVMNEMQIKDLSKCSLSRKLDSFWSKVAYDYSGFYSYNTARNIFDWYSRNVLNLKNVVDDHIHSEKDQEKPKNSSQECYAELTIKFHYDEWKKLEESFISKTSRKRFVNAFDNVLNDKFRQTNPQCKLKCYYNWLNTSNYANYFNGVYYCIDKNCQRKYLVQIKSLNVGQDVVMKFQWTGELLEHKSKKPHSQSTRIIGNKRKEFGVELMAKGVCNFRNELLLERSSDFQNVSENVLRVIKHEYERSNRISSDVFTDCLATKQLCDHICFEIDKTFNGYIQNLGMNPFGFALISSIQLKIWEKINNSVWFFDSTGSIIKKVANQKHPYLYSFVCHDQNKHQLIPIAEFVSTRHTTDEISKNIFFIKKAFESFFSNNDKFKPKVIVTDFSWALLNSVVEIFNPFTMGQYLSICYNSIMEKENLSHSHSLVRPFICATHLLKSTIRKAKKINGVNRTTTAFIYMFTLLQNSITFEQFQKYLLDIFVVLNQKFQNPDVYLRINFLLSELKNRKLNCMDIGCIFDEDVQICEHKYDFSVSELNSVNSLKNDSPFSFYFKSFLDSHEHLIHTNDFAIDDQEENQFFNPKLFGVINNLLKILPLWTGIWVHENIHNMKCNTRITNNPVENWFKVLKHTILQNKSNIMPSELVSLTYKNLKAKYLEYYFDESDIKDKNDAKETEEEEKWKDKKSFRKVKGIYYQNFDLNESESETETSLFKESFGIELEKQHEKRLNISHDSVVFQKMKELYFRFFTQKSLKFDELKSVFEQNKEYFIQTVSKLRSIEPQFIYKNEIVDKSFDVCMKINMLSDFKAIKTTADGNCFYHATSKCLFNDESYFFLIKMASCFMFFLNPNYFDNILFQEKHGESYEQFLLRTYADKIYAYEINVLATSIAIKRAIFVYSFNSKLQSDNRFYCSSLEKKKPILLCFNSNHFVSIMPINSVVKIIDIDFHFLSKYVTETELFN